MDYTVNIYSLVSTRSSDVTPLAFQFDAKRRAMADPDIEPLIKTSIQKMGLMKGKPAKLSNQEVIEFIFFPVVNEGCRGDCGRDCG